ncbi:MAG: gamma-glutamyltransferase, partial [Planctomycetota bacterium]|nr:gamma-glutamyltransferase [Planctomycetota bacterium]
MSVTLRYDSRRQPVLARRVVATGQPLAAQAGLDMIRRGGNAIDAAITTAITLTVVEPTANGLGSDAFGLVWHQGSLHGLNASGRSPRGMKADEYPNEVIPSLGWPSVTVPGAVSAWVTLSERFGTRPFAELFEAGIEYAQSGFPVSPQAASGWARAAERYQAFPEWQRVFAPGGQTPGVGDIFRNPDQAVTLQQIAESNGDAFYHGEIAQQIAAVSERDGGLLRFEDLDTHEPLDTTAMHVDVAGAQVHELPPNGQGIAALVALGIVDRLGLQGADPDDSLTLHRQIEAMKIGFEDAFRMVADPELLQEDPANVLSEDALDARVAMIDDHKARPITFPWPQWSSTVYLASADDQGNAVSFIQSNYEGFGSGVVIDGTGIAMQNRGTGFHP